MNKTYQKPLFFGLAISDVAKATHIPCTTIWRHANGKRKISIECAAKYSKLLGIPLSSLRPDLWPPDAALEQHAAAPRQDA